MTEAENRALEVLAALEGYQRIPFDIHGGSSGEHKLRCCNVGSSYIGKPWNAWRKCTSCGRIWKVEID